MRIPLSEFQNIVSYELFPIISHPHKQNNWARDPFIGRRLFDKQKEQSIIRYSVLRLESLGYNVTITELGAS